VTQDSDDRKQLEPMAKAAKEQLTQDELTVIADAGYSNGKQFQACEDENITAYVPVTSVDGVDGLKSLFSSAVSTKANAPNRSGRLLEPPSVRFHTISIGGFKTKKLEQENRCQPKKNEEATTIGHGGNHYAGAHRRVAPESRQSHWNQDPHQCREQQVKCHGGRHHYPQGPAPIE
jgi:hypothetical protein